MTLSGILRGVAIATLGLFLVSGAARAEVKPHHVNTYHGLALKGFDAVAYFTQNKAVKGDPEITAKYQGATYEFASKENKALFEKEPAKYAPQFGGFCAFATSEENLKVDVDPHAFLVKDGKLFVNFNEDARDTFAKNYEQDIVKGHQNWPHVRELQNVIR